MQAFVENISASQIIFMRRTGAYGQQNFKLMQDMKEWISSHNLWDESGVIYGIAQDNVANTPSENCRYDVCFVTDQIFEDDIIHYGTLPAGAYLVYKVLHTTDEIGRFWASIGDALAEQKSQIDECRPILERYQFSLVEKGYCEFCIPVLS